MWNSAGGALKTLIVVGGVVVTGALLLFGLGFVAVAAWLWFRPGAGKVGRGVAVVCGLFGVLWFAAAISALGEGDAETVIASVTTPPPTAAAATTTTTALTAATTTSVPATTTTTRAPSTTTMDPPASTTTTVAPTTTSAAPDDEAELVIALLGTIIVQNERQQDYDRDLFPHWSDLDDNGCDTREDVLLRDARTTADAAFGCAVSVGDWYSAYDDTWFTDPGDLEIDHVVALKEAWDSGAWAWDAERREAFANDMEEPAALIAVSAASNGSKGDADPSNWIPPHEDDQCRFIAAWVVVKAKWSLSMDQSEFGRIRNLLRGRCEGTQVGDRMVVWPSSPPPPSTTTTTAPPSGDCHPSYPGVCIPSPPPDLDCADIPFRRFEVTGSDPHRFDADDNGLGCES